MYSQCLNCRARNSQRSTIRTLADTAVNGRCDEVELVEVGDEEAVLCDRFARQLVDLGRLLSQPDADDEHVDARCLRLHCLGDGSFRVLVRDAITENDRDIGHILSVAVRRVEHLRTHVEDGVCRVRTDNTNRITLYTIYADNPNMLQRCGPFNRDTARGFPPTLYYVRQTCN